MKLYEITAQYQRLMDDIAEGNIPAEAVKDTLDAVEGEFDLKLDNLACYVKSLNAEAKAIKNEIDTLTERMKSKQAEADRLIEYMYGEMSEVGKDKIETARCKLTIKQNPEAVTISDNAAFIEWAQINNDDLLTYARPTINKTKIKETIKSGETVPMCSITRGQRLEVK